MKTTFLKIAAIKIALLALCVTAYINYPAKHWIESKTHTHKYDSWYSTRHNNGAEYSTTLGGDSVMYVYSNCTDSGYTYTRFDKAALFASGY